MSPLLVSFLFAIGFALFLLGVVPRRYTRSSFAVFGERKLRLAGRLSRSLKLAGIYDQAPLFMLVSLIVASLVLGALIMLLAGSPYGILSGPVIVGFTANMYLIGRQRSFLVRASNELVPFLRRVEASVRAGRPVAGAYRDAVAETETLRLALDESAAKMSAGMPFIAALSETTEQLPLRMWIMFVRQLEIHETAGGNLAQAIAQTVTHIDTMLQLQAQARADYANQARQQKLIVLITFAALAVFVVFVNPSAIEKLTRNVLGIGMLCAGLGLILAGLWIGRKTLRDIDRRLNF